MRREFHEKGHQRTRAASVTTKDGAKKTADHRSPHRRMSFDASCEQPQGSDKNGHEYGLWSVKCTKKAVQEQAMASRPDMVLTDGCAASPVHG